MAHFKAKKQNTAWRMVLLIVFFAAILFLFGLGIRLLTSGDTGRQKESLSRALEQDITYCYATEGHYPASLDEIQEKYGLVYNKNLFVVDYQVRGANIRPDVTILDRQGEEASE